jgi:M6 family metalloprotease-like protein
MIRGSWRWLFLVGPLLTVASLFAGGQPPSKPDTSDYRTVETAITAKLTKAVSADSGVTGYLGAALMRDGENRLVVEDVQADSPAAKAGIKKGDVVTRIGEHAVSSPTAFREWLQTYNPGDTLKLGLLRDNKAVEITATLTSVSRPMTKGNPDGGGKGGGGKGGGGKGGPPLALWQKPVMRLAVVRIEFPDIKHNDKVAATDWEEAFFSKGTYHDKKNATGQSVFGSLNDYFLEQSVGKFHLEGKVFDWVDVGKKRADYAPGNGTNNRTAVLLDGLAKVVARDGKDAFKDIDAFLFLYAGEGQKTNSGHVYYPFAGSLLHEGQRWPYLVAPEGAARMTAVNGFAKLTGQLLGLPDLAAKPEQGGFRGLGVWCVLSTPIADGRPQHLSAWAKEKLGWIQPVLIDPTVKQKLLLAPIEDSPKECFKILVRPNGSEYYLVENRKKKGFDADLPAEGLLIWRILNDRPTLCESHGIDGPTGPQVHLASVPFPSEFNNAFTPDTTPSSRSPLGGGLPVHLTEIRRLPDGKIAFSIGYDYR